MARGFKGNRRRDQTSDSKFSLSPTNSQTKSNNQIKNGFGQNYTTDFMNNRVNMNTFNELTCNLGIKKEK